MHVTLQDVAKLAGVSTKTVSRVVNNQGEISETTRQRVQAAIEQLGYQPNIKVMIGGALVTEKYASEIGADLYAPDASSAATRARQAIV